MDGRMKAGAIKSHDDNRIVVVFDGQKWHVRHLRAIEFNLDLDEKVYHCDKPISNDHNTILEIPLVRGLVLRQMEEILSSDSRFHDVMNIVRNFFLVVIERLKDGS